MNARNFLFVFPLLLALAGLAAFPAAVRAEGKTIALTPPDKEGGLPLLQALNQRHTTRSFSAEPVSDQDLSNLLWATWGINRADGRRTAPTAKNTQKVQVYVARADGVWRYAGETHSLEQYSEQNILPETGEAPLALIYAAPGDDDNGKLHVGSLYQNAGLYCASAGLGNVVKLTGADQVDDLLELPDDYEVLIVQPIGHPN